MASDPRASSRAATIGAGIPDRDDGAGGARELGLGHGDGRRLGVPVAGGEPLQHQAAALRVDAGPDLAHGAEIGGQGGGQRLPGGDADQRHGQAKGDALGQRDGGAQPGEAAGPDHDRHRLHAARLLQEPVGQHRQGGGLHPRPFLGERGEDRAVYHQRGGTAGEGTIEGEEAHRRD
jgi:hypothetical protein